MLLLSKRYRQRYNGEDVISERVLENGHWNTTTERIPNNVINNQISNRAAVFSNGLGQLALDPRHIINKKSGLLGAASLQTYGCNAFYRDYNPDFLIATDLPIVQEMFDKGYHRKNIVYTRVDINLRYPRSFYLIPYDPYADAGTTALYLACFDGHKTIYMLGFDGQDTPGFNNNIYAGTNGYDAKDYTISSASWRQNQVTVFNTYTDVDFVFVTETGRASIPESWKYCLNLRQISCRDMVLEADL